MEIYTIGFTKKRAVDFFGALKREGIQQLLDVRLSNASQLAGFTKRDDLEYFLREICGARYVHEPRLAPTKAILDRYKKGGGTWSEFERAFRHLLVERRIDEVINRSTFELRTVLLCSEPTPERCHRRLVVEHLVDAWGDVTPIHL